MDQQADQPDFIDLAAEIVAAFVSHNRVQPTDLPNLIGSVHQALTNSATMASNPPFELEQPKVTPQQISRSITPDHLISFEDGKRYKTLRRHLTLRGLTPQAYREKWGLPTDYPMVSPGYSQQRSELAMALGLGQQRRQGLAKVSTADGLKVEAFEEMAESPAGEAVRDEALAQAAAAAEVPRPEGKAKKARSTRTRKRKSEPAAA